MRTLGIRRFAQGVWVVGALAALDGCGRHPFLSDRLAIEAMVFEATGGGESGVMAVLDGETGHGLDAMMPPPPPRRAVEVVIVGEDGSP